MGIFSQGKSFIFIENDNQYIQSAMVIHDKVTVLTTSQDIKHALNALYWAHFS